MGDSGQAQPEWEFRNDGKEILQKLNSSPGIAIGRATLSTMEFEGTIYVGDNGDDDWIGALFSFQVKKFLQTMCINLYHFLGQFTLLCSA